jgi:hypothetical protein
MVLNVWMHGWSLYPLFVETAVMTHHKVTQVYIIGHGKIVCGHFEMICDVTVRELEVFVKNNNLTYASL